MQREWCDPILAFKPRGLSGWDVRWRLTGRTHQTASWHRGLSRWGSSRRPQWPLSGTRSPRHWDQAWGPWQGEKHSWVKVLWILMMSLSKLYSVDEWSFVLKVDKFYIEWKRLRRDAVVPRIWLNASTLLLEQGIVIIMIQTDRVTLTSCWPIRGRDDAILTN